MKTVDKISLRSVIGVVKAPPEGVTVDLMTVRGIITGKKLAQSNAGPSLVLLGKYESRNIEKNEYFGSSVLQLPNEALEPLHDKLTRDEFPFLAAELMISVIGDKRAFTKYRCIAREIRPAAEIDLASYFAAVDGLPAGQQVPDMQAPVESSTEAAGEQEPGPVQTDIEGEQPHSRRRRA